MAHISIRKVTKELNLTKKIIMSYNYKVILKAIRTNGGLDRVNHARLKQRYNAMLAISAAK